MPKYMDQDEKIIDLTPKEACRLFGMSKWIEGLEDKSGNLIPNSEFKGIACSHAAIFKAPQGIGYSLMAIQPIKAGTVIGTYAGEQLETASSDSVYNLQNDYSGKYCDSSKKGNELRFIQSALSATALSQRIVLRSENSKYKWEDLATANVELAKEVRFLVKAITDIKPGQMLVFNYGDRYWATQKSIYKIDFHILSKRGVVVPENAYHVKQVFVTVFYPGHREAVELLITTVELNKLANESRTVIFGEPEEYTGVLSAGIKLGLISNQLYLVFEGLPRNFKLITEQEIKSHLLKNHVNEKINKNLNPVLGRENIVKELLNTRANIDIHIDLIAHLK